MLDRRCADVLRVTRLITDVFLPDFQQTIAVNSVDIVGQQTDGFHTGQFVIRVEVRGFVDNIRCVELFIVFARFVHVQNRLDRPGADDPGGIAGDDGVRVVTRRGENNTETIGELRGSTLMVAEVLDQLLIGQDRQFHCLSPVLGGRLLRMIEFQPFGEIEPQEIVGR